MKIGPTVLHNFGPFRHVEFDLSRPGLTGIEGVMHDRPGCTSNGSGKSKLLGGISWVLFDDPMCDGWAKDDVIRLQFESVGSGEVAVRMNPRGTKPLRPEDGCWGRVHVVQGEKDIRVERYRGHPTEGNRAKLYVDGEDVTRGKDALTNLAIESALGMNFRAFISSVAFGARDDVKSFFSATDAVRKGILDTLLGMEIYAEARLIARARLKVAAGELDEAERAEQALQERIAEQESIVAELAGEEELAHLEFAWKRAQALTRLAQWQEQRTLGVVDEARDIVAHAEAEVRDALDAHARECREVREKSRDLQRRLRELTRTFGEWGARAKEAEADASRWGALDGTTCVTCGQVVSQKVSQRELRKARKRRDEATTAGEEASESITELEEELAQLREPSVPATPELDAAREALALCETSAQEWSEFVRALGGEERAAQAAYEKSRGQRGKLVGRMEELRNELLVLVRDTLMDLRRRVDQLTFWVEGFGPGGLRSFLIEAEVPEVNRAATRFAQRLLGAGTTVQLFATRKLATGAQREELEVRATIPGCTIGYAGASKGQRRRLDLALLLAFREIVGKRSAKSFDQLFADELFDGLDEGGEESVIELLREIADICPVAFVTHSDALKSAADRLLVVHHREGVAELEEVG